MTPVIMDSVNCTVTGMNLSSWASHDKELRFKASYNWPALFLFVIVFMTISGNILVCLAVKYKRKLQNMFNYFLV